jgi:hypothetical protein
VKRGSARRSAEEDSKVNIDSLREEAQRGLLLTAVVSKMHGGGIEVGESFQATFQITNAFGRSSDGGAAPYRDVHLHVSKTDYARPKDQDEIDFPLADVLEPGASVTCIVDFVATAAIRDSFWRPRPEPYVHVRAEAELDISALLSVSQSETFFAAIDGWARSDFLVPD